LTGPYAPPSVVLADGGAPAVLAFAPLSVVLAYVGAPAVLANTSASVVLADGGAPAVLAPSPYLPVCAEGGAPAVHALALASAMRAFRCRLRRPDPLLPPLRLRLLPLPFLPACRFPLAPTLSALAPLLAMRTLALFPASAPATAPSFSVSVLPLVRLALALVPNGLVLLGGLASLGGPWHRLSRCQGRRSGLGFQRGGASTRPPAPAAHEVGRPAPRGPVMPWLTEAWRPVH
jgi:hypothetical protein